MAFGIMVPFIVSATMMLASPLAPPGRSPRPRIVAPPGQVVIATERAGRADSAHGPAAAIDALPPEAQRIRPLLQQFVDTWRELDGPVADTRRVELIEESSRLHGIAGRLGYKLSHIEDPSAARHELHVLAQGSAQPVLCVAWGREEPVRYSLVGRTPCGGKPAAPLCFTVASRTDER